MGKSSHNKNQSQSPKTPCSKNEISCSRGIRKTSRKPKTISEGVARKLVFDDGAQEHTPPSNTTTFNNINNNCKLNNNDNGDEEFFKNFRKLNFNNLDNNATQKNTKQENTQPYNVTTFSTFTPNINNNGNSDEEFFNNFKKLRI